MTENSYETRLKEAKQMFERGVEISAIENKLRSIKVSGDMISQIVEQLLLVKKTKNRKTGIICIGIGCFLLVFGFILTLLLFNAGNSISMALFVPTIIGLTLLITGMALIMG